MGKGDKKSRRGKIFMGSYGVSRPKNKKGTASPAKGKTQAANTETKAPVKAVAKKAVAKKKAPKKSAE